MASTLKRSTRELTKTLKKHRTLQKFLGGGTDRNTIAKRHKEFRQDRRLTHDRKDHAALIKKHNEKHKGVYKLAAAKMRSSRKRAAMLSEPHKTRIMKEYS